MTTRALFVTLLAETHDHMLEHLHSLAFFDPAPITHALYYVSGFEIMEHEGLHGLLRLLIQEVRTHRVSLLVIDGVASVWSLPTTDISFRRFIQELSVFLQGMECTALLLTQRDDAYFRAEHTMVDGLLDLADENLDVRAERSLTVSKFRGSGYLRGRHLFKITDAGIVVYPRTEAMYPTPRTTMPAARNRMAFDIAGLDAMLHDGVLAASTTAIVGVPGSGKTLLGLHFLAAGARRGEVGLYVGFYEDPERLVEKADAFGLTFSAFTENGMIQMLWETALEQPLDVLATQVLEVVQQQQVRRLVIDSINSFQQAALYPERLGRFYTALFNELRARQVTTLVTVETPHLFGDPIEWPVRGITSLAENMIFLRYIDIAAQLVRLISILKVRDSAYDATIRTLNIDASRITVASPAPLPDTTLAQTTYPTSAPLEPPFDAAHPPQKG